MNKQQSKVTTNNPAPARRTRSSTWWAAILTTGLISIPSPSVIETGDPLFGWTVVSLTNGRFSLNDRAEIVFHYGLADGRSGIAVAVRNDRTAGITAGSTPIFRP
jgi:hypothetical protein